MCDFTNCTENGINRTNTCYKKTNDSILCCCLSEGCNGATSGLSLPTLNTTATNQIITNFSSTTPTPNNKIKCYQNQTRINSIFQFSMTECPNIGNVKATGCLTYTDFQTAFVTRMCDYSNCTENGVNRSNSCYNGSDGSIVCCCVSDGCNGATSGLSPSVSTLNTSTTKNVQNFSLTTLSPRNTGMNITDSTNNKPIASISSSNDTFFCYQGEGYIGKYNLSSKQILCPSKKCILFTAYCNEYWASTCYNDHTRMTLFNMFKTAEKLLTSQQYFDIKFCNVSNCNRNISGEYHNILKANPTPFYPQSYKNQKHQRPKRKLENSVIFQTDKNENISFTGTPEESAEKVWIEFRIFCSPEFASDIYKLRYTFDRKKLTVNQSTGITRDKIVEDLSLKNLTSFSVFINSTANAYSFYVNGNDQKLYFGENSSNCSKMLVYGGKWKSIQAGISNKTHIKNLTFSTSFEPDPSKYSSCTKEDIKVMIPNPNIKYTSTKDQMINDKNQTLIKFQLINPLQPYGLADIEFRKSLCEFSDLIKVQIRSLPLSILNESDPNFYYSTTIWTRKNYLWSKYDDRERKFEEKCAKLYVRVSESDAIMFFCDNSTIFSLPIKGAFEMAQFSAQSIKKQYACF
uniref:Uncharacterized protein n=1 Tax=Panagrolaimus sp. PS1159 TaxID=55785 RepID=A0AC35FM95_9BILA